MDIEEYLEKFCYKHEISREEALKRVIVQEYIKDLKERGKIDEVSVLCKQ